MAECNINTIAHYHLPGLYEFTDFYRIFLDLFREHREYFYDWCDIGSIYGAPADCLWGGGRVGFGEADTKDVLDMLHQYGISGRLTFSNSLLTDKHLDDKACNRLCRDMEHPIVNCDTSTGKQVVQNGIIIHSDLLLDYLISKYPGFYYVSSTTKVITEFDDLVKELDCDRFRYVVPDFRFNHDMDRLSSLTEKQKAKIELLCNECCSVGCRDRKQCYENVSRKSLGEDCAEHICSAANASEGYRFSSAMDNPAFISISDIQDVYLPMGISEFKIEGRGLGSAVVLEMLLYYMTKPKFRLKVREAIYLDSMLDLF